MLLEQAKQLTIRQTVHHVAYTNRDGTPQRWRVNGAVKTWKRSPNRVRVSIKYGQYGFDYITEDNLDQFELPEDMS